MQCAAYLDFALDSGAVHSARYVDGVSPDVILRPPGPDDPRHHWTHIDS